MVEYFLSGFGLRLFQLIVQSSIWIVAGLMIAAVFRRMIGAEKIRKIFGNDTRWGLLAGWLIGMLLPVCSLGVIPIAYELHRARVKQGTIIAFALTAPLFNPMSVLYGLTLSDPFAILAFTLAALLVVTILGAIWNRFPITPSDNELDEPLPAYGVKRATAVIVTACRELVGPCFVFLAVGILGSVVLTVALTAGTLQNQLERTNIWAPALVAVIATPVYATPLQTMSQIGGMFQHGNSIGAAFSLLIMGTGANLGLLAWLGDTYGFRRVAGFWLALAVITTSLAYAIDKPLIPKGIDPAGHTHAFDIYTHPFQLRQSGMTSSAIRKAQEFWVANEFGGTYLLLAMVLVGALVAALEKRVGLEAWYLSQPTPATEQSTDKKSLDIVLPGWFLGAFSVAGLVGLSVLGCYLYYPSPGELLPDMKIINTECVLCARTGEWDATRKWVEYADDLSRRMEVGIFLREGSVDEFIAAKARVYRDELDNLRDMINEDTSDRERIKRKSEDVNDAFVRLRRALDAD